MSYPKDRIFYCEIPLPSWCQYLSPLDGAGTVRSREEYGSGGYPIEQLLEAKGGALKVSLPELTSTFPRFLVLFLTATHKSFFCFYSQSDGVHNFRDGYVSGVYQPGAFKRLSKESDLKEIEKMATEDGVSADVAELLLRMERHNSRLFDTGIGIAVITNEPFVAKVNPKSTKVQGTLNRFLNLY